MRTLTWVIVALIVIAVVVALAVAMARRRREERLRRRFGPEYDRAVERSGSPPRAQAQLEDVARRREQLDVTDLSQAQKARFDEAWLAVQSRFVDEPGQAVTDADGLITAVMHARGYPVEDFEERAWLLAADHADVVDHYRQAAAAHHRHLQAGTADTEDLRQAFVHYRMLYGVLSGRSTGAGPTPDASTSVGARDREAALAEREAAAQREPSATEREAAAGAESRAVADDEGAIVWDDSRAPAGESAPRDRRR